MIALVMAVPATTQRLVKYARATLPEMSIQGDDLDALMREMS